MRIAILSRGPDLYSTRRLIEAAESRGHQVDVLNTTQFAVSMEEEYPDLYYQGEPVGDYDAVLPRIGSSITYFGTAVVRQFEQMDVFCVNSALGILNSRDKLRSLQILSKYDIGIPRTEFVSQRRDVLPAIERLGGAPVIIKLLEGTQGVGVILAETTQVAAAIVETLQSTKQDVLLQKFVAESRGKDVRALVVEDRVVAAMRRKAVGQEFRSNVHRGGSTEVVELDDKYERTAVRAAQILGLRVAGVDMLEGEDGPQIAEVNSSPGLEGIEGATGLDIAGSIIDFMSQYVRFPELDIRQRLTVSKGYGVCEFAIPHGSEYAGTTIGESGVRELDVQILSLTKQGGPTIPNPKSTRELEEGDRILCFGKLSQIRKLQPEELPRRRLRIAREQ